MNIDEDAMLVAIGRMSMDEAREKYADQWAEFCQKLTNWKSVHQMFRLAKLHNTMVESMKLYASYRGEKAALQIVKNEIKSAISQAFKEMRLAAPRGDATVEFYKIYDRAEAFVKANPNDPRCKQSYEAMKPVIERLDSLTKQRDEAHGKAEAAKAKYMEAKDQYDITKPYAMGLLVADVFYSLSAALEGDIY